MYCILKQQAFKSFWAKHIRHETCQLDHFISLLKNQCINDDDDIDDLPNILEKATIYLLHYITNRDINNREISIVHLLQATRFLDTRLELVACLKLMAVQKTLALLPCLLTDQFEFEWGKELSPVISLNYGVNSLKKVVKVLTSFTLASVDQSTSDIKVINFYGRDRAGKTITLLRACHVLLHMKTVVFIDMNGLHDINAANVLYNDDTKEIQILFRIMVTSLLLLLLLLLILLQLLILI